MLVIFDTVPYTVTKHAAVGLAEWLAATYDDQGIRISTQPWVLERFAIKARDYDEHFATMRVARVVESRRTGAA